MMSKTIPTAKVQQTRSMPKATALASSLAARRVPNSQRAKSRGRVRTILSATHATKTFGRIGRSAAVSVHARYCWCESATVGGASQGLDAVQQEQLVVPGYHALGPPLANLFALSDTRQVKP